MENVGLFGGLIYMAIIVLMIVSMWKIFEKAGQPGWAALIPIYNTIVMIQIVGKPVWWILLLLIPGINIIFGIWLINLLAKSFGKDVGFTLGLIFLSLIFYPILGLGDAKYQGPAGQ
ncbi:MAG: DUF5684 domain-containing protein [Bacteroidales bacterium]|nr:DUF5684 domain-containing protein [Bacteroidales bacterium]